MKLLSTGLALTFVLIAHRADAGPVLDAVRASGQLVCGVNT